MLQSPTTLVLTVSTLLLYTRFRPYRSSALMTDQARNRSAGPLPSYRVHLPCSVIRMPSYQVPIPCYRVPLPCYRVPLACYRVPLPCLLSTSALFIEYLHPVYQVSLPCLSSTSALFIGYLCPVYRVPLPCLSTRCGGCGTSSLNL